MTPHDILALYRSLCPEQWPTLAAQGFAESRWNPDAVSPIGAQGLAQFLPSTFRDCIQHGWVSADASPLDPTDAITAQREYMKWLLGRLGNDVRAALAAYNFGIGNVTKLRHLYVKDWPHKLPAETFSYIRQVMMLAEFIALRFGD